MSDYCDYVKEREGRDILEKDYGFATYVYFDETCYIIDVYIKPEARKKGSAYFICEEISAMARDRGCKYLLTSVDPKTNGTTASLYAILSYNFKLLSMDDKLIFFRKEL